MPKANLILKFENGETLRACSNGLSLEEVLQKYPLGKNICQVDCYGYTDKKFIHLKSIEFITNKEDDQC